MPVEDRRIVDLTCVEVEHMVASGLLAAGSNNPGRVVLRVHVSAPVVALAHVRPDQARTIAMQLLDAAARADYEGDFYVGARDADWPAEVVNGVGHMVRRGETARCDLGDR